MRKSAGCNNTTRPFTLLVSDSPTKEILKLVEKMEKQERINLEDIEENGLKKMRMLNKEFLAKNKGSEKVRDYMTTVGSDDALMLIYLKGRKYRPEHAWETLKRKAEVRFDEYPEVFVEPPGLVAHFVESGAWGILRNRDNLGRRIICSYGRYWDPTQLSITDATTALVLATERLLLDNETLENGIVYIQDCGGMGMNHIKQYTLPAMLRMLNVLWYACPLKFKEVYFINVPYYLSLAIALVKPFFSKKLKERLVITTTSKKFEAVHARIDPAILPKSLDGELEEYEAFEMGYFT